MFFRFLNCSVCCHRVSLKPTLKKKGRAFLNIEKYTSLIRLFVLQFFADKILHYKLLLLLLLLLLLFIELQLHLQPFDNNFTLPLLTYLTYSLLLPVEHRCMETALHLNLFWATAFQAPSRCSVKKFLSAFPVMRHTGPRGDPFSSQDRCDFARVSYGFCNHFVSTWWVFGPPSFTRAPLARLFRVLSRPSWLQWWPGGTSPPPHFTLHSNPILTCSQLPRCGRGVGLW